MTNATKQKLYPYELLALIALTLALAIPAPTTAGPLSQSDMIGGRVGAWINTGDKGKALSINGVQQQVSSGNLYGELFYSHAFSSFFRADVSLGVSNRSDITATGTTFAGGINIYPMQVGLRVYPLGNFSIGNLHPYALGGIGLYVGSQTGSRSGSLGIASKTATDINYVMGGGFDIPVAETIAISAAAKYYQIKFPNGFLGLTDYSGYSITAGIAYLFPFGGKEEGKRGKR